MASTFAPSSANLWRWRPRPTLALAAAFLALIGAAAIRPELFASGPNVIDPVEALQGPSLLHWFGTDPLGRDTFTRVVYGARPALALGLGTIILASLLGSVWGLIAGLGGRVADEAGMRFADVLLSLPVMLMALLVLAVLGPGARNAAIAVAIPIAPGFARIVRVQTLLVRDSLYVRSAIALGVSRAAVIRRHVIPNVLSPLAVLATMGVGSAIIAVSSLSYLGLGTQPPSADWGGMLAQAQSYLEADWALGVFPGLALTLTVVSIGTVGRALQASIEGRELP